MWRRLFPNRETTFSVEAVWLEDDCTVAVVGEASYQDAIRQICGSRRWEDVRCEVTAALIPEPTNKHDPNAIQVQIDSKVVGYLSRGDALDYGPMMQRLAARGKVAACKAVIAGRGQGSETMNLGVFLHMCEPE
jgi:hypothetical protein